MLDSGLFITKLTTVIFSSPTAVWNLPITQLPVDLTFDWLFFSQLLTCGLESLTEERISGAANWRRWITDSKSTTLFTPDLNRKIPEDLLFLGEEILNDPISGRYVENEIRRAQVYLPDHSVEDVWDIMTNLRPEGLELGLRLLEEEESRPTDYSNLYTHKGLTVNVRDISDADFFFLNMEVEDRAAFESLEYVRSMYISTTPTCKLFYPEPFIASPSFTHNDLGFLHILQYQFWLWFMFIFLVVFYFVTFLCVVRWCANRNQPRRETRGVSRSKCGDLITSTVPVTWAISIIVSESTDATDHYDGHGTNELIVGIRAYQWGWEYYYPHGIDLNYNLKANYTTYGGKSLRYNTAAHKSLMTRGVWKSYQQKDVDQVVTPAHLLVLPLDNSKLLNFMRFKTVGASVRRDSEAFKRIRSYSKVYSMNLVHTPSVFTEKYIKLNNLVSTSNDVNTASSYGLQRQHNLTAMAAANGTSSTFLDRASLDRFLADVRQYSIEKQKTQVQTSSPSMWQESNETLSTTSSKFLMDHVLATNLSPERLFWRSHLTNFELFHIYPMVVKRLGMVTKHTAPKGYSPFELNNVLTPRDYSYDSGDMAYVKGALGGNPLWGLLDPMTWWINAGRNLDQVGGQARSTRNGALTLPYGNYSLINNPRSNLSLELPTEDEPNLRSPRNYSRFDASSGDPVLGHGTNSLTANLTNFSTNQVTNSPVSYLQLRATRWDDLGRWNALASNRLRAQAGYAPIAGNFSEYKPLEVDAPAVEPDSSTGTIANPSEDFSEKTLLLRGAEVVSLRPTTSQDSVEGWFPTRRLLKKPLNPDRYTRKLYKKTAVARREWEFWNSEEGQKGVAMAERTLVKAQALEAEIRAEMNYWLGEIRKYQKILSMVEEDSIVGRHAKEQLEYAEEQYRRYKVVLPFASGTRFEAVYNRDLYGWMDLAYQTRKDLQDARRLFQARLSQKLLKPSVPSTSGPKSVFGRDLSDEFYPRMTALPTSDHLELVADELPSPYFAESNQAPDVPEYLRWDQSATTHNHVNPDLLLDDVMRYVRGENLTSALLETDCSDYNYKDPIIMARWESRAQKQLLARSRQRILLKLHRSQHRRPLKLFHEQPDVKIKDLLKTFGETQIRQYDVNRGKFSHNKAPTSVETWMRQHFYNEYLDKETDECKWYAEAYPTCRPLLTPCTDTVGRYHAYERAVENEFIASRTRKQFNWHSERVAQVSSELPDETSNLDVKAFYPSVERTLAKAEQTWLFEESKKLQSLKYVGAPVELKDLLEKEAHMTIPNFKTHPSKWRAYMATKDQIFRDKLSRMITPGLRKLDFEFCPSHNEEGEDLYCTQTYSKRPATSWALLAANLAELIPGQFLAHGLSESDVNHLNESDVRTIKNYLNPLLANPELYEEVLLNRLYRRGQYPTEILSSTFASVLSQYHGFDFLTFKSLRSSVGVVWKHKLNYSLNRFDRRDWRLSNIGDYYSHTLDSDNFLSPTLTTLSKDRSLLPLTGKRLRKSSSVRQYNTIRTLFSRNSTLTIPFTTPFIYPQSHISVLMKSNSVLAKAKWKFDSNLIQRPLTLSGQNVDLVHFYDTFNWRWMEEEWNGEYLELNYPNSARQTNPIVVRSVAKNARAGYNALRKVVKLRFEEGRAHTHTYHAANVGVERPFSTNSPLVATKLLGKNRENFYSSAFCANRPFGVFNELSSSSNSLNSYFFDFPFLVSQLSTPSRFMWFDWYTRWARLDIQPASDASKATLIGSQRLTKLYQLPNEEAHDLGDSESYLIRNQRYRRNHLPIWLYNVSSYNKAAVWTQNDWTDLLAPRVDSTYDRYKDAIGEKRVRVERSSKISKLKNVDVVKLKAVKVPPYKEEFNLNYPSLLSPRPDQLQTLAISYRDHKAASTTTNVADLPQRNITPKQWLSVSENFLLKVTPKPVLTYFEWVAKFLEESKRRKPLEFVWYNKCLDHVLDWQSNDYIGPTLIRDLPFRKTFQGVKPASRKLLSVLEQLQMSHVFWNQALTSADSTSTQFTGSFSSSYRSTWRPYTSVQSYHYNVTTLIDLLTRRELLYRQYFERTNKIIRLPRPFTVSPQNPLIAEVKASFKLIDPLTYASEYSREHYYYSMRYFRFLMFKGWIASLGVGIKDLPINPNLVNEYLFFYFLSNRRSTNIGSNNLLYKSQFRPLKKGITNMIRLHGTGAVAMPIEIRLQILASSRDVIHSWAIPSAGIKIDCIPGYTSHRILIFLTPGIYWGQCMEICGRYHHWMPIVVYFMKRDLFFLWCTHFGHRKDQKLLWDTDDRQFSDYLKLVSYDRTTWLTELSKRM